MKTAARQSVGHAKTSAPTVRPSVTNARNVRIALKPARIVRCAKNAVLRQPKNVDAAMPSASKAPNGTGTTAPSEVTAPVTRQKWNMITQGTGLSAAMDATYD